MNEVTLKVCLEVLYELPCVGEWIIGKVVCVGAIEEVVNDEEEEKEIIAGEEMVELMAVGEVNNVWSVGVMVELMVVGERDGLEDGRIKGVNDVWSVGVTLVRVLELVVVVEVSLNLVVVV